MSKKIFFLFLAIMVVIETGCNNPENTPLEKKEIALPARGAFGYDPAARTLGFSFYRERKRIEPDRRKSIGCFAGKNQKKILNL
jgi:hypothetical protein